MRTGNLDFLLLQPVDEQFLATCQRIDWALVPETLLGLGIVAYAGTQMPAGLSAGRVLVYLILLGAGLAILYSLLVALTAVGVWTVRHEELYETWFLVMRLGSYPSDVYRPAGGWGTALMMCVAPVLVAVNVPARYGAMMLVDARPAAFLCALAGAMIWVSRWFFRRALRSYQGASA